MGVHFWPDPKTHEKDYGCEEISRDLPDAIEIRQNSRSTRRVERSNKADFDRFVLQISETPISSRPICLSSGS
jgi:hypothetical protein